MRSHIPKHTNRSRHRSIFIRLLLVVVTTMLMVHLIIGGLFGFLFGNRRVTPLKMNLDQYANYLMNEIGSPPDTLKAATLAELLHIDIRIENEQWTWSSNPDFKIRTRRHKIPKFKPSSFRRPTRVQDDAGTVFYFKWKFARPVEMHRELFFGLIALITLIFWGTNHFIRKILKPIKWLKKGVDEVSKGNLDTEIPIIKHDELGSLSESFNQMTRQIKEMLKSRDQLLLDVSHELRSPLTRMKVALELMPESEKKSSVLSDIHEIETMITEILESERMNSEHYQLKYVETDLNLLIQTLAYEFQNRSPGLEFTPSGRANISVDVDRIKIVFKNILENAYKYSKNDSKSVQIKIGCDAQCIIQFIDDGPGIPEEHLKNIFEPFYRVDRSRSKETGGYGLGLHMCKKIIEAHQGEISICNNIERGATVTIKLPLRPKQE